MPLDAVTNFAKSALSAGYAAGVTAITLVAGGGAKFPAVAFNAVWWNASDYADPADDPLVEIVRVTNIATDTFTVTRGQEGTADNNHNIPGKIYKLINTLTQFTYDIIATAFASTAANEIWAGPGTGAAAGPAFRLMVSADLPALNTANFVWNEAGGGIGAQFLTVGPPITSLDPRVQFATASSLVVTNANAAGGPIVQVEGQGYIGLAVDVVGTVGILSQVFADGGNGVALDLLLTSAGGNSYLAILNTIQGTPGTAIALQIFDQVNGTAGNFAIKTGAGLVSFGDIVQFAGANTTGAGAALLGANCPAVTPTAPYTWIELQSADGSTVYMPVWK